MAVSIADVQPANPFAGVVEAGAHANIASGHACGGPGEPCGASGKPYFRQGADATRGQIAKIVYGALTTTQTCAAPSAIGRTARGRRGSATVEKGLHLSRRGPGSGGRA